MASSTIPARLKSLIQELKPREVSLPVSNHCDAACTPGLKTEVRRPSSIKRLKSTYVLDWLDVLLSVCACSFKRESRRLVVVSTDGKKPVAFEMQYKANNSVLSPFFLDIYIISFKMYSKCLHLNPNSTSDGETEALNKYVDSFGAEPHIYAHFADRAFLFPKLKKK
jgi:hypothetical protein